MSKPAVKSKVKKLTLTYFYRSDCPYCQEFDATWQRLRVQTSLLPGVQVSFVKSANKSYRRFQDSVPCLVATVDGVKTPFPCVTKRERTVPKIKAFLGEAIRHAAAHHDRDGTKGGCACGGADA
jgi:glutaredoxin